MSSCYQISYVEAEVTKVFGYLTARALRRKDNCSPLTSHCLPIVLIIRDFLHPRYYASIHVFLNSDVTHGFGS